ncbi:MAG: hypothetical protein LBG20_02465 [Holosporaceae bacterium]|nr:hypothetical protein [Holosporaceae bacterium]
MNLFRADRLLHHGPFGNLMTFMEKFHEKEMGALDLLWSHFPSNRN